MKNLAINYRKELATLARFGVVGILATLVHLVLVWIFIGILDTPPLLGNALAFLIAFFVSFSGHYWWTFKSSASPFKTVLRFFLVSISGFLLNTVILYLLLKANFVSDVVAASIATICVPLFSFMVSRFWVFNSGEYDKGNNNNAVN